MSEAFDPYRKWLGIPLEEQPPHHYRLLGVTLFEADADVVQEAADRQMAHVQRHKLGQYSAASQKLLNELTAAKLCLLNPERRAAYDAELRRRLAPPAAGPAAPPAAVPPAAVPPAVAQPPVAQAPSVRASQSGIMPRAVAAAAQSAAPIAAAAAVPHSAPLVESRPELDFVGGASAGRSAAGRRGSAGARRSGKKSGAMPWIVGGAVAAGLVALALASALTSDGKLADNKPAGSKPNAGAVPSALAANVDGPKAEVDTPNGAEKSAQQVADPAAKTSRSVAPVIESEPAAPPGTPAAEPSQPPPAASPPGKKPKAPIIIQSESARVEPDAQEEDSAADSAPKSDPARIASGGTGPAGHEPAGSGPSGTAPAAVAASPGFDLGSHGSAITGIAVAPDSNQVVSCSLEANRQQTTRFWDLSRRSLSGRAISFSDRRRAVGFSPDGHCVLMAAQAWLQLYSMDVGRLMTLEGDYDCLASTVSSDKRFLVAAGGKRGVHMWDATDEQFNPKEFFATNTDAAITAIAISPDGSRLYAGSGGQWDDNPTFEYRGGADHKLHVWNLGDQHRRDVGGHHGGIWGIALSRDGRRGATASDDHTLRLWDLRSMKTVRTLTGHEGPVYAVAMSADGKQVLSGGADRTVRLWNADTGREVKRLVGHTDIVRTVALTPDSKYALSGGNDKLLKVWDLQAADQAPPAVAEAAKTDRRRPAVPSQADVEAAVALIRDVFADDYKQAKKPPEKIALAEKLLRQSADSQNDTERYALLGEARRLAGSGGSAALAIQIVEQTGIRFDIDAEQVTADFAEQLTKDSQPAAARKELAETLLPLADTSVADSHYASAKRLLTVALQAARKANDPALVKQISARLAEVSNAAKAFDAYQAAVTQLAAEPADKEAHLAAGKYLCFVVQDWQAGAKHLAEGSDPALAEVAEFELKAPADAGEQARLGDLWWTLFDAAKGHERSDYAERTEKWYTMALPGLKGLKQTKISKRLEDLAAFIKERPGAASAPGADRTAAVSNKPLAFKIRQAIMRDKIVQTASVGRRLGNDFVDIPPAGMLLAGFNYTIREQNTWMTSFQPIYWSGKGTTPGTLWGNPTGDMKTVTAAKGYAVAGLRFSSMDENIQGYQVIFARIAATGLDLTDKYRSDWMGREYEPVATIGDNGQPMIGIFGALNRGRLTLLGLVHTPAK